VSSFVREFFAGEIMLEAVMAGHAAFQPVIQAIIRLAEKAAKEPRELTANDRSAVEKAVMQCRAAVTAGKTLAEPLRASGVFPPMVIQMISVGEQTGALDAMLSKIADFYDDEVDTAVGALTALLEPIMIVILGVLIGGLVVAMYLPIFKLVTLVK
jgi:type II secretory pathway component PulF